MDLTENDLVVGDFDWTRLAVKKLGASMPEAPDYPKCLKHLLNRKIQTITLGEVKNLIASEPGEVFIKPSDDVKAFAGLKTSSEDDWMEYLLEEFDASLKVHCSEVVKFVSEYRAYVVHGEVRAICHYMGDADLKLDESVVQEAVKALADSAEYSYLKG